MTKTTSIRWSHMNRIFRLPDKTFYDKFKDIHNLPLACKNLLVNEYAL